MALSRPYVLVLLAAVLGVATLLAFQSAGQNASAADDGAAPVVTRIPKPGAPTPSTTTPAKAPHASAASPKTKPKPRPTTSPGVPPAVARALDSHAVVVLFFRQPGADDTAVASAVNDLRRVKKVKVFSDRLKNIGRYRRVVAQLGISQAPAVVIVGKGRKARLIEGFVDPESLRQQVQDSR